MRSVDHGLATMDAPAGILIAYSTAPGAVAMDGNGRDSPYTEALSQAMRNQHEPVEQVFKHVRVGVMSATANKQVPWESSSLTGDFYFSGAQTAAVTAPNVTPAGAQAPVRAPSVAEDPGKDSGGIGSRISGWFGLNKSSDEKKVVPVAETSKPPAGAAGNLVVASAPVGTVPGSRALPMLKLLGLASGDMDSSQNYSQAKLRELLERGTRHVSVGNSPRQIEAAFALCQKYAANCSRSMFSDETTRTVALDPFDIDPLPVSVVDFRQFVEATHYRTDAEKMGYAYDAGDTNSIKGGDWRNGLNKRQVADESAVVAVSFQDALAYCKYKGQRLPTEDEWEFIARGPERHTFPWGENTALAAAALNAPPRVADGPAEGIGGRYHGLSGNVWQWVDTQVNGRKVLKGASWLETNPAYRRAATRRMDVANRADEDSGFRCAKSLSVWPDAELYVAQLK
jgi:formylglycine-generating enzyme required for sulfatase activity